MTLSQLANFISATRHDRSGRTPIPQPGGTGPRRRAGRWLATLLLGLWTFAQYPCTIQGAEVPIDYAGSRHSALGRAALAVTSGGLQATNLGPGGQDGVAITPGHLLTRAVLELEPVGLETAQSQFGLSLYGLMNGICSELLGKVRFGNSDGIVHGYASIPRELLKSQPHQVAIYNETKLVTEHDLPANGDLGSFSDSFQISAVDIMIEENGGYSIRIESAEPFVVRPSAAEAASDHLVGNRIRIRVNAAVGQVAAWAGFTVTAANLEAFTIHEEAFQTYQSRLRIQDTGPRLLITWDMPEGVLQGAPTLQGPWKDLVTDTTAFEVSAVTARAFYRLVLPVESFQYTRCQTKRNVLLLIADDVGVDQFPPYIKYHNNNARTDDDIFVDASVPKIITPTLGRLSDAGVSFLNAWSSPTCSPTRAGLYTGNYSFRHGVYSPTRPNLPADSITIAQVLADAGYTSGLFGKWHLGDPSGSTGGLSPLDFGWDRHYGIWGGALPGYFDWTKVEDTATVAVTGDDHYATHENVDDALDWIGSQQGHWIATVAFNASHWAQNAGGTYYELPPTNCAYRARTDSTDKEMFRSITECMDRSIGELLDGIDPEVLANTTIIFVGDNGTDAGITDHYPTSPVNHAKGSLYEGGVNIPLIIADGYTYLHGRECPVVPFLFGSGRVVSPGRVEFSPVQTQDLFATIADLGGGDSTSGLDSVSMLPYLSDPAASPQRTAIYAETRTTGLIEGGNGWNVAYRDEVHRHKLIVKNYGSCAPAYELYDLANDRWETVDLLSGIAAWPVWMGSDFLAPLEALLGVPVTCP